jgi:murein L,D-transpeptidase YcbB/YkuD
VIDARDLREALAQEKPRHAPYAGLKSALARYRQIESTGGWSAVPPGATLRTGDTGPRVAALRARLTASDDLRGAPPGDAYDDALGAAVGRFQARHGLTKDGIAGPRTIEEMNVPVGARIDQLRVNLERGRWLLHDIGDEFVAVNIAGFELYLIRNENIAWSTRVQVGKPYRATPVFRSRITYLVFNPTWTVPPGILANDILPAQKRDRSTLAKKGLEVLDARGNPVAADSIDWENARASRFPYMLRQAPGPSNALGRVKFMFPNDHAVYLHDTPSKSLFEKDERAFSSGCIRVHDPLRLAEILLEGQKGWSRAEIDRTIAAGATRSVTLATPVPVWPTYWTAWVDADGVVQFRRDLYGRDAKVLSGLGAPFSIRKRGVQ